MTLSPELVTWALVLVLVGSGALASVGAIAAYRNGVADGWRARKFPNDPLWQKKVGPIIHSYWPEEFPEARK